ncbi:MAG: Flp family type IVb pilin [Bdellovibrionales bacterium]
MSMLSIMRALLRAESGSTAIEYSLIAGLIAAVVVVAIIGLGQGVVGVLYTQIQLAL